MDSTNAKRISEEAEELVHAHARLFDSHRADEKPIDLAQPSPYRYVPSLTSDRVLVPPQIS